MTLQHDLLEIIRDYPDFPKPGIVFKDICPLLAHPTMLKRVVRHFAELAFEARATQIIGIESRGFLFGVPLALEMGLPFVPARKMGKLPGKLVKQSYALEYGTDHVEIQAEALSANARNFVIDDVIATGGTAAAVGLLASSQNSPVCGYGFLLELGFLNGREALAKATPQAKVHSLLVI